MQVNRAEMSGAVSRSKLRVVLPPCFPILKPLRDSMQKITVYIGGPVLQILSGIPRYSEWVFPAASGNGYSTGLPKIWERVRDKAGLKDVRLHDLRHSFASFGAAAGDSLLVIGKILGHKDSKTTSRYAHLSDDPVKSAANRRLWLGHFFLLSPPRRTLSGN